MSPLKRSTNLAARMGRWSARHRKTAIFGWLAFVAIALVAGSAVGMRTIDDNDINVGEARTADHIIRDAGFRLDQQREYVLVQSTTLTVADPGFRAVVRDAVTTLDGFPQVTRLQSPLDPANAGQVSKDGHAALVQFSPRGSYDDATETIDEVTSAVAQVADRHDGFVVAQAGTTSTGKALDEMFGSQLARAGMISIPLTLIVLLLVFGSVVGALVPLLLALSSVAATIGLIALPSHAVPMEEAVSEVILLIGLAVGVDYSLFYIRRERDERRAGRSESAALEAAAATSGRAVLVSGITVMIAMAGMLFAGDKTFTSFGIGTIMVVAVAMLGSLTVLPAVLAWLGDRVDRGRIPVVGRRVQRGGESRLWAAVLERVLRRPVLSAAVSAAVLVALAVPAINLHTATSGLDSLPASMEEVRSLRQVEAAFPGGADPAVVAIAGDASRPDLRAAVADLRQRALASGEVRTPITVEVAPSGKALRILMPLAGKGTDDRSNEALATLRDELIPATVGAVSGVEVAVTGTTAASFDWNAMMKSKAPIVFVFVLAFAFLLLLVSFRSIVVALKAVLLNLLSVAAAYGVVVMLFQWGWASGVLDFQETGGIAAWLPVFLFVILFGLSMDYHVFILSRIREYVDRGLDTEQAVTRGIRSTASVVTSAAIVMVFVFSVFATMPIVDMKEMGIGLAAAILIDATIVRAVLLPATMKLLGRWNWYLPRSLQWLPRFEHERALDAEPEAARA